VISARSGLATDIQAAVNLAKMGDTVTIPAGTFHFTGQVFAPDGIYIKGAGRDSTYLIKSDNLSEWHGMFTIDAKTGQPFKFSGITLEGRLATLQGTNRTTVVTTVKDQGLVIYGAAKNIQIFDSRFTKFLRAGIEFRGDAGRAEWGHLQQRIHRQLVYLSGTWRCYRRLSQELAPEGDAWQLQCGFRRGQLL
jgi:hypothetical protein